MNKLITICVLMLTACHPQKDIPRVADKGKLAAKEIHSVELINNSIHWFEFDGGTNCFILKYKEIGMDYEVKMECVRR